MKEVERENIIKDYTRMQKEPLNAKRAELRRKLPSLHVAQRTLPQEIKDGLMKMIADNEVINARELSEEAIKLGVVDNRYSTGKPIIYPEICIFLDRLCTNGELELMMEQSDIENRIYQKLVYGKGRPK